MPRNSDPTKTYCTLRETFDLVVTDLYLGETQLGSDLAEIAERLRPYVADTTAVLLDAWKHGRRILLEGAQGFGLDVDHGSYPFVTSSTTGPAGVPAGTVKMIARSIRPHSAAVASQ